MKEPDFTEGLALGRGGVLASLLALFPVGGRGYVVDDSHDLLLAAGGSTAIAYSSAPSVVPEVI